MLPYGFNRYDLSECKYGCCTTKCGKRKNCRKAVAKARKHRARQQSRKLCNNPE